QSGPRHEPPQGNPRAAWGSHGRITLLFLVALLLLELWEAVPAEVLCLVLSFWLLSHGVVVYRVRLEAVPPERRRTHRLAGWPFLAWFVLYQILFLFYCVDVWRAGRSQPGAAPAVLISHWVAPPALVLCLLLALLALGYGFLKYHFGARYLLVAVGLFACGGLVNSLSEF